MLSTFRPQSSKNTSVMAWLTRWNQSFWPAVFMHGAINSVYDSLISKGSLKVPLSLLIPFTEIAVFALFGVISILLVRHYNLDR